MIHSIKRLVRDIMRIDQLRVRERRLLETCEFARAQNADMQRPGARRQAPDGQHWCDLIAELQPYERN